MEFHFRHFSVFISILFVAITGNAQPKQAEYSQYLKQTVETHANFWVRVHAAEALVANNYTVNAEQVFKTELKSDGAEKIGALRVLYKISRADSIKQDSIAKEIFNLFQETEHEKLIALETMGKLGLYFRDKQIFELARAGHGGIKVLAQWGLANSGNTNDLNALVDLLFSEDSIQFRYAAYSLRFLDNVSPEVYLKMKEKLNTLDREHPFRIYLISALHVHAPTEDEYLFKDQLLAYLDGEVYERYEVNEALAVRGSKEDIEIIEEGFSTEKNDDVRVAAANAFLTNEHYVQN